MTGSVFTYVAVGGPMDGRKFVAELDLTNVHVHDSNGARVRYLSDRIRADDVDYFFWRAENISRAEALQKLFTRYHTA